MNNDLLVIDPPWAWAEYEPSREQPWNRARAAHAFRRAGFAGNWEELNQAVERGPSATIDGWFAAAADPKFETEISGLASHILASDNAENLPAWWLYRMLHTPAQLLEKTTLFWHGHFATSAAKVDEVRPMLEQNQLLRQHALGRFEAMVQGISRDPAMLLYLDSATNRKIHPNENFAREVMELFCLGLGNYSEKDIQELARCFTGWEIRRGKFHFNRYQHDSGAKTVLGTTGTFNGDEAVRLLLKQPAAGRFIARKLVRYFVTDHQPIPDGLIEPLAEQLRRDDFSVGPTVRRILSSRLFFSDHAMAGKIRSPIELAVGLLRSLEATTNVHRLAQSLTDAGQTPFFPPNVKGWDGGRTWINSSTLVARANLVTDLVRGNQTSFAGGGLDELAERHGATSPPQIVDWLCDLTLAVSPPATVRERLIDVAKSPGDRRQQVTKTLVAIAALPEFQLG